jgi:hypothetical protein
MIFSHIWSEARLEHSKRAFFNGCASFGMGIKFNEIYMLFLTETSSQS